MGAIAVVDLEVGDLLGPSMLTGAPDAFDGERLVGSVLRAGRYPEARNDLNRAIDEGETAAFRFHMAYCQSLDRNPDEAESELRQAIELGLKPYQLHPAERAIYQRLIQDLGLESLALN